MAENEGAVRLRPIITLFSQFIPGRMKNLQVYCIAPLGYECRTGAGSHFYSYLFRTRRVTGAADELRRQADTFIELAAIRTAIERPPHPTAPK